MILKAFGILDVKADMFRPPFFMATNGQAVRAFSDAAQDKSTDIGKHPEDYKLVVIGTFDDNSGALVGVEHESLGFAAEFVRSVQ